MTNEQRIEEIRKLNGTDWSLWKFYQERADQIRARLWTIGTWLVAAMGALLVFLNESKIIEFQQEFPYIVQRPLSAIAIAVAGLALSLMTYFGVRDNTTHIKSNFADADCIWRGQRCEVQVPKWANSAANTLKWVAVIFGLAFFGILVLSLWSLFGGGQAGQAAAATQGQVTLLTINDVYRIGGVERGQRGGPARVRSLRQELEARDPELLLLHAGDAIYPSLLSRTYDGAQMIDILNRLDGDPGGFDPRMFAVLGNHEFDKSRLADAHILAGRIGDSQFTWLRSNVAFVTTANNQPLMQNPNLQMTAMVEANGFKIGLFGLTTDVSRPEYVVEIGGPLENARRFSRELRDQGADLVVALTHLTVQQDMAILKALSAQGPDLIIGGHEHTKQKEEVEGRWVLKADADAVGAWVVRVTPRPGEPPLVEPEYRRLAGDLPLPDAVVQQTVEDWHARHDEEFCRKELPGCLDVKVGQAAVELVAAEEQIRSCETNFGDWIADQARAAFPGAQAALINAGSLRLNQNLPKGPIRRRDLEELFEYDNQLRLIEIDGETLQKVVRNAITGWPGNGRWLQISGFGFRHDTEAGGADQLLLLDPHGAAPRPIAPGDRLRVVTTDFLLDPEGDQDGYKMLNPQQLVSETEARRDLGLKNVVIKALEQAGPKGIRPQLEGRIVTTPEGPPCTT